MSDELNATERHALDAWAPIAPPAGFADRVLAARDAPARRRRWPGVAAAIAAVAAVAAIAVVVTRDRSQAATGSLAATERTTAALGGRAVAVAEGGAAIDWRIDDDGAASIDQTAGDVFYRVDRGGPFVVHTPAGDVRVTGTCFRIEVTTMNKTHVILSATAGAAIATAAVITVYEGHVVAETRTARTEMVAGARATIGPDGKTTIAAAEPTAVTRSLADDARASRDELIARAGEQRVEIGKLRARLAELEQRAHGDSHEVAEPGRAWHDPSPELLASWVGECHVRSDEPGLDRWQPLKPDATSDRGIERGEIGEVNAAMAELQRQWKQLVRSLYIEATGDTAGADTLSLDAMRGELQEKGAPDEHNLLLQRIAMERAGQATAPADLSKTSPFERYLRAYLKLGDQAEAAIGKRLGPERAKAIRGDAWGSRSQWSGCPRAAHDD